MPLVSSFFFVSTRKVRHWACGSS